VERSAIVKAVADPESVTPAAAALVTFWPMITPEMGANTSTRCWMILVDARPSLFSQTVRFGFGVLSASSGACFDHGLRDGAGGFITDLRAQVRLCG